METIIEKGDYKVTFNGSATYSVVDSANQCRFASSSKRKAINKFNSILKATNTL